MKQAIERITSTAILSVAFMLCTTSAWANPSLLSYKSFDNIASSGGVSLTREAGSVDFTKIDGDYVNYTTTADAKLGAHAYQANNGTIGLQDNTSGLVSMSGGWTISFWFHPNTTADWRSFFGFGLLDGNNYHFVKSGAGTFTLYGTSSSANPTTDTETLGSGLLVGVAFTASAWNHIAIVSQPVDGEAATVTATLYVNGSSAGTFTMPSGTSLREVLLRIGRNNSGANSAYYRIGHNKQATWFDDFALFSGVLSDTMISAIAGGRSTVTDIFNNYEENKTISLSGDMTFTVDKEMTFETIAVENPSGEAATLTFTGSYVINATQINVPANVTVKVDSSVSGTPVLNAPVVLSDATSTLEIAAPATISKTISGYGGVVVSANAVVFTVKNTFTGGLTVKSGGLAKTTVAATTGGGFGGTGTNPQVGTITVENGGTVDVANCYSKCVYSLTIEGDGVDNQGAVICSSSIGEIERQITGITLTGNASISCANNWGLIASEYTATTLTLGSYTLEKKGSATFWLTHTTVSGTGTLDIKEGILATGGATSGTYNTRGNWTYTSNSSAPIVIRNGAALTVSNASLRANSLTLDSGSSMSVGGGAYALVNNSGTLTANGSVSVAGTLYIGWSGNASFVVGSDVEVTGTGLIHLMSTATITKQGSGTITIGPNATVKWINCAWTATAGDIFRGEGTLFLDGSGGNWTHFPKDETFVSAFSGILKIGCRAGSDNYAYWYRSPQTTMTASPTLVLACGTDDNPGKLQFGQLACNQTLTVKNLSGCGIIYPWSTAVGQYTIETLQTGNTSFTGNFTKYENNEANSALVVRGNENEVNSLTLSGASTTKGAATVRDNAKLIFASTGSWENGTVTVADGGYLEVNNSDSVASTLDLQSGGTIVIKTVTTTTTGEGEEAVEETTTSVVPIAAGTVTFPDSGEAVIDISTIPDLASGESVAIINAATSLDSDVSKIRLVGKPYSLSVDDNALKVVNDGGLVWDSAKGWGAKDATKYDEATITSPGTVALDGTSLSFDTLTLTGSGTVSFSATGDETITVNKIVIEGSGVTLDASAALSIAGGATITGDGTLNIPNGVTLTLDGVTCSVKITAQNGGTLVTKGTTTLSSTASVFSAGSNFNVESGTTAFSCAGCGLKGNQTISAGATLSLKTGDALDYYGHTETYIFGTLNVAGVVLSLEKYSGGNNLHLYPRAEVSGDWIDYCGGKVTVHQGENGATGTATLSISPTGASRLRANTTFEIEEGMTCIISGNLGYSGTHGNTFGIVKTGDGILSLTGTTTYAGVNQVNAGQMISTHLPAGNTVIAEGATFTLKDAVWSGSTADKFSGLGTLELLSTSGTRTHTATGSTFAGIVKLSNENGNQCNLNPSGAAMFTARPELIANSTSIHLGNDWLNNLEHPLQVKNLSGSGQLRAQWTSGNFNYLVDTVQECDTDYTGTISCDVSSGNRYVSFLVKGNNSSEIHSLGITQAQNTSNNNGCKASTLTVSDYGKVVFKSAGGWGYGTVVVGNNGYLQSESTATSLAATLTLQDGATVVRGSKPVTATALTALDANATIKIAFADDVTPADGMVVLSGTWGTTPDAARFAFADSTLAGEWILTKSADGLSIAAAGAQIVYSNGDVAPYTTMDYETLMEYTTAIGTDEGATLRILDNTTIDADTISYLATQNLYYDNVTKTISKAVAKVVTTTYPSLSAAISDGAAVTLLRDSSEAITLNGESIVFSEGSSTFSGSFTGNGTLIMTALPKSLATTLWSEGWTGTLWLKNITFPVIESGADAGKPIVNPVVFGNANSTLRLTSCSGGFDDGYTYDETKHKFPGTLDLVDENDAPAFSVTSGWPAYGKTVFAKLTGTGTLTSGNPSKAHYYQILDASEFRGTITIPSNDRFRVGIGSVDANLNNGSSIADKTLTIQTGASATIAAGKNWTAAGGFIIDGTLTIESNDALSSKAVKGGGTVVYRAAPNSGTTSPSFDASLWTGTVELPEFAAAGIKLAEYGTGNSKIKINGITSGYLMWEDQNVQAEVVLQGNLNITATSHRNYTYAHMSGSGSFSVSNSNSAEEDPSNIVITQLDVSAGSVGMAVTNNTTTTLAINNLVLPTLPPCDTKVLSVGGTGTISLDVGNVKVGEASLPAKYKLERRHVGEEGDGFYVYYNGTIFSVY